MKSVSLKDAMGENVRKPEEILLNGVITPEQGDASLVRLYPNPLSSNEYYLISAQDISAVHQWEPQELLHTGIVGHTLHRITLGAYAKIKQVTVTLLEARHSALFGCGPAHCMKGGQADCNEACPQGCHGIWTQNDSRFCHNSGGGPNYCACVPN